MIDISMPDVSPDIDALKELVGKLEDNWEWLRMLFVTMQQLNEEQQATIAELTKRADGHLKSLDKVVASLGRAGYYADEYGGDHAEVFIDKMKATIAERDATIARLRTWIKENAYHAGEWCPAWDGAPAECECGFEEAALGEGE